MQNYEYKVVPAPTRGQKARGVKTPEGRFANALQEAMNTLAAEGWEYQRAETLPSEERSGLTSRTTHYRNVLVFRRAIATETVEETAPLALTAPASDEAQDVEPAADEASPKPEAAPPKKTAADASAKAAKATPQPDATNDAPKAKADDAPKAQKTAPLDAAPAQTETKTPEVTALRPEDVLAEEALAKAGLVPSSKPAR